MVVSIPSGENKMRAVLIYDRLDFAGVWFLRKALLHAPNVFRCVPQHIILCANEQELPLDIFYLDELWLL